MMIILLFLTIIIVILITTISIIITMTKKSTVIAFASALLRVALQDSSALALAAALADPSLRSRTPLLNISIHWNADCTQFSWARHRLAHNNQPLHNGITLQASA
jgi:hypothetical protein